MKRGLQDGRNIAGPAATRALTPAPACGSALAMCGRFTLTSSPEEIAEFLALEETERFPPRYNIAPTQPIMVVLGGREARPDANHAGRRALLVRWGLIPAWVKDPRDFPLLINARSETAAQKNSFRAAMKYRRCLIPASGFYEWRRDGKGKPAQAYFLKPRSGRPVAFAGLMETFGAVDGSEIDTAAILTTSANRVLSGIHDRMPVTVEEGAFERWLNCRDYDAGDVADLLRPAGDEVFEAVAVSDKVNKVANTSPDVQHAVTPAPEAQNTGMLANKPPHGDKEADGPAQPSLF